MLVRSWLFGVLLAGCSSVSHAETISDPISLKGVELGSDIAAIRNSQIYDCKDRPGGATADSICLLVSFTDKYVANAPIDAMSLSYYNDKLYSITVLFNSLHFKQISEAFVEKYGRPAEEEVQLTNRMGAAFVGKKLRWKSPTGGIMLFQYQGDLNTSQISLYSDAGLAEYNNRSLAEKKKNANNL